MFVNGARANNEDHLSRSRRTAIARDGGDSARVANPQKGRSGVPHALGLKDLPDG